MFEHRNVHSLKYGLNIVILTVTSQCIHILPAVEDKESLNFYLYQIKIMLRHI
jgi:hypothetical protein